MGSLIQHSLGFGYFPGIAVLGLLLLRRAKLDTATTLPVIVLATLGFTVGLVLTWPLLFVAAWVGAFKPVLFGVAGWTLTAACLPRLYRELRPVWARTDTVLLLVAALIFAWHGLYRNESIFSGRDQGVYSNHAAHIARTGDLRAAPPYADLFVPENSMLISGAQAGGYFFDATQENIYFQFPPTFAITLAQAFGGGGFLGMFLFNPLLAALNTLLFYEFARRLFASRWAWFATALFSLNLAQIWIARITLSEVITQTWLLGGLILLHQAFTRRQVGLGVLAHALIATCTFVRIDAYLVLLGLCAFDAWSAQQPRSDHSATTCRQLARAGATIGVVLGALAFGYGFLTSPGYYHDFSGRLAAMLGIATAFTVVAWLPLPRRLRESLDALLRAPRLITALSAVLVLLALYAWWIRPHIEPFAQFAESIGWEGRDYRENSLRDLAAYLSPPAIAFMLVGLCLALRRTFVDREWNWAPFLALWAACTLLYLYNPYISTDHIWKIRRFVPVILPGMVLLATLGLQGTVAAVPRPRWRPILASLAGVAIFAWVGWSMYPLGFARLNGEAVAFIQSIKREIPRHALVVATVRKPILGPIQLVEQVQTLRARPEDPVQAERLKQLINLEQSRGRTVMLLSPTPMVANPLRDARRFELVHPNLLRTTEPPPRELKLRRRTAFLSVLGPGGVGIDPHAAEVRLGANPIYGVPESGFAGQEYVDEIPFRWTTGPTARLDVPWAFPSPPQRAFLDIMATSPDGAAVKVTIDEHTAFEAAIPAEGGVLPLDLTDVDWTRSHHEISVHSSTFRPSDFAPESTDHRELGVRLGGIVFSFRPPGAQARMVFGFGRNPYVKSYGLHPIEPIHGEPARWTNGFGHFEIELPPNAIPRQLTVPIAGVPRDGTELEIWWEGHRLQTFQLDHAPDQLELSLPSAPIADHVASLELRSPTFDPNSHDRRELGVMIGQLTITWH
ncbi:ArnT family glycosyltransferase [Actomonas aquatica]|uniref:Glycosyltransferase RgtA/B/C/D-like domain-containing protein n=1 Tax=Actomonas aquatica TaxID=2866162 RepID=A0ABZ1C742_9BACT|nr:hypothetical protein [Opitutus sp. WL0086]WRQ87336.1 hypothetical protein K1X11_021185 [Opitutus sp. WL0086]